jgi:thiamine pyrophosphokinase
MVRKIKKVALFLNATYRKQDTEFYLKLLEHKYSIAVDGGIRFFLKNKIYPDLLVGDLDSAPRLSREYIANFKVIKFPTAKDKTDCQLAIEYALKHGADSIDICGAVSSTEIDHTIGNIFLLDLVNRFDRQSGRLVKARLVSPLGEVYLLEKSNIILEGKRGDFVSVIPLEEQVRLEYSGLKYPAPKKPLVFGDSLTLRNQMNDENCQVESSGKALVIFLKK